MANRFRLPWRREKHIEQESHATSPPPPKLAPTLVASEYDPIRYQRRDWDALIESYVKSAEGLSRHRSALVPVNETFESVYDSKALPDRVRPRHVPLMRLRAAYGAIEQPTSVLVFSLTPDELTGARLGPTLQRTMPWCYGKHSYAMLTSEGRRSENIRGLALKGKRIHPKDFAAEKLDTEADSDNWVASGSSRNSSRIKGAQVRSYLAGEILRAPLFLVDGQDLVERARDAASQLPEERREVPDELILDSQFVAFSTPVPLGDVMDLPGGFGLRDQIDKGFRDHDAIGVVIAGDMMPRLLISKPFDDGKGSTMHAPGSRAMSQGLQSVVEEYLAFGAKVEQRLQVPDPTTSSERSTKLEKQLVVVVQSHSQRRDVSAPSERERQTVTTHPRRGAYVKHKLSIERLQGMGYSARPEAQHFWVGTRRGTRVNDPAYRSGDKLLNMAPDEQIQVRLPGVERSDLPERPVVNGVYAETIEGFQFVGMHPRAYEMETPQHERPGQDLSA